MDILKFIEHADFFEGASRSSKENLAGICIPRQIVKKEVMFNEGDIGSAFYLLATGSISLHKNAPSGKDIMIKIVQPGEIFAEVILFELNFYPVTAVCVKSGTLFSIPKNQFYSLLNDERFRNDFLSMLMRKQRYLTEKIRYLTMHDVDDRFFQFLQEHYTNQKKIRLSFSKKDIASAIGTTPETFSRLLNRLVNEGRITMNEKCITISDTHLK
ncbi:MAG TPA: Crp/Fnr family transcriptional regulator [Chitinispirillaceae bacterium]|nr:Crp/Fnr family transcriptional regulator [Chitinispirillaceae bacterium]